MSLPDTIVLHLSVLYKCKSDKLRASQIVFFPFTGEKAVQEHK